MPRLASIFAAVIFDDCQMSDVCGYSNVWWVTPKRSNCERLPGDCMTKKNGRRSSLKKDSGYSLSSRTQNCPRMLVGNASRHGIFRLLSNGGQKTPSII